jgi:hypothetical protein
MELTIGVAPGPVETDDAALDTAPGARSLPPPAVAALEDEEAAAVVVVEAEGATTAPEASDTASHCFFKMLNTSFIRDGSCTA